MSQPLVTVIIATPERGATLRRPLRYLGRQTIRDQLELVLRKDVHVHV